MGLSRPERRQRIKYRIRKKVNGTNEVPRMCIFRSNKEIYAQLIDDATGKTIFSVSSRDKAFGAKKDVKKIDVAGSVGKAVAEKALSQGISQVVFDRNGYLYHGRVRKLAEAAREGGLKF